MAHLVETMMYTNERPWHGLGEYVKDAPSVDQALELAGINWRVEKQELYLKGDKHSIPGHYALVRDSDGRVLDVVGKDYVPFQNKDTFKFFKSFVEAGGATMETAGSLKGGRMIWGLAKLKREFKVSAGDVVKNYLLLATPHEQGKSLIAKATNVRAVCNNTVTLALAERGLEFRKGHRTAFDDSIIDKAKEVLGLAEHQLAEFEDNAKMLRKLKLNRDDAIRVLAPIFQKNDPVEELVTHQQEDNVFAPRMKVLLDVLERAPGAEPDNAWGVLNAVTYWADHLASRTPDKRLERAWFGKSAQLKVQTLDKLLAMAA